MSSLEIREQSRGRIPTVDRFGTPAHLLMIVSDFEIRISHIPRLYLTVAGLAAAGGAAFATPMTPTASRPPALPVGWVFRSSAFS